MSFCLNTFVSCPALQDSLDDHFMSCDVSQIIQPVGFTEFLNSSVNTNGLLQRQLAPGGGKKRQVELVFMPRILESDVNSSQEVICNSTNETGDTSETYDLGNLGVEIDYKITLRELEDRCEEDELFFAKLIQNMFNVLMLKSETDNITQAALLFGKFGPNEINVTADVKTVKTQKANGDPNIDFLSEISFASRNMAYCSVPYVFGWQETFKAFKKLDAACCADDGLELDRFKASTGMVFIPSHKVESILGTNHFFTVAAGALQLLQWFEFEGAKGIRVIDNDLRKQGVLVDPRSGFKADYIFNNTCPDLSIQLKRTQKVVGLPTDLFCTGDPLDGVTFANEYAIVNP